jgi:hypothetical protein
MKQSSLNLCKHSGGERRREHGTSLVEVLVGITMFSLVGLSLVAISSSSLRELSLESRTTLESFELKRGMALLTSELRMSSFLSPYLPGTAVSASDCSAAFTVTERTVAFFISLDEPTTSGAGGLRPYYVGYRYDPEGRRLLRGEIEAANIFSCDTSIGDPTNAAIVRPVASNVIEIDADGDGETEPAFEWQNGALQVNLGTFIDGGGEQKKQQKFSTRIYGRVL